MMLERGARVALHYRSSADELNKIAAQYGTNACCWSRAT